MSITTVAYRDLQSDEPEVHSRSREGKRLFVLEVKVAKNRQTLLLFCFCLLLLEYFLWALGAFLFKAKTSQYGVFLRRSSGPGGRDLPGGPSCGVLS